MIKKIYTIMINRCPTAKCAEMNLMSIIERLSYHVVLFEID